MKRLLLLLTLACTTAFAAEPTLVVPPLSKPSAKPAEDDPFQAKYDAAWTRFEDAVGKATAEVTKALDSQFEKAADAGNLDLADMWDKKKQVFLDTKTLEWPSDGKAKTEWRKTNPKVDFPDDFSEAVATAQQAYAAAIDTLKADYEALVKEYTKTRNLERAKQVREEMVALDKKPAAPPARPKMVEEPKATKTRPAIVGAWVDPTSGWSLVCADDSTAKNLNPKGALDTAGTWAAGGNASKFTVTLGAWTWHCDVQGNEMSVARYVNGNPKGTAVMTRRPSAAK